MKQLIAGIVIILVVGIGAFLYRNTMEKPNVANEEGACTLEAKVCPDGTSVGRAGPSCEFAPCPLPNVDVPEAGIAFAIPAGYAADENAYGAESTLVAAFEKPSLSGNPPHTIIIRRYPIPAGKIANDVILANTRYQPADMQAESMERFTIETINSKTFYSTVIERFEAQIQSAYYLPRATDVLRFEVMERDVVGWMEPGLVVKDLPQHAALHSLLRSLQTN